MRFYCELFFLISFGVFGQDIPEIVNDSIPLVNNEEVIIDSLERISEPLPKKENKIDSLEQQTEQEKDSLSVIVDSLISKSKQKKRKRKKRKAPEVKPMSSVTILDYKYSYMDDVWKSEDTALTIYNDYDFNFLRRDNFELLSFPNMGETYNRLGYDFQSQPLGPQIGARGKHFGYFEKEDIPYYNVPSPFSDLFFKSTFDQGQHLDSQLAINTSPRFNVYIGYRGFRSLGHYASSRSAATQFRMSAHYETYNKRLSLIHI